MADQVDQIALEGITLGAGPVQVDGTALEAITLGAGPVQIDLLCLEVIVTITTIHQGSGTVSCAAAVEGDGSLLRFGEGSLLGTATLGGVGTLLVEECVFMTMRTTEEAFTVEMSDELFEIRASENRINISLSEDGLTVSVSEARIKAKVKK